VRAAGERRSKARGVSRLGLHMIWGEGGWAGVRAPRRRPVAGAARLVPARPAPDRGKARQGQLQGRLRVLLGL
jgi:hypothetical protein